MALQSLSKMQHCVKYFPTNLVHITLGLSFGLFHSLGTLPVHMRKTHKTLLLPFLDQTIAFFFNFFMIAKISRASIFKIIALSETWSGFATCAVHI